MVTIHGHIFTYEEVHQSIGKECAANLLPNNLSGAQISSNIFSHTNTRYETECNIFYVAPR